MKTKNALIIFVRNPVLGKVKTRIAATLGNEKALAVYKCLLAHTCQIVSELEVSNHIFYADGVTQNDIWEGVEKYEQVGNDLGERMNNAFVQLFDKGFRKIVIIGSDCMELSADILDMAFEKLDIFDMVVGPAKDGGYYLLGMNAPHLDVFKNIDWSTDRVLDQTMHIIHRNNLSIRLLPELKDVDKAEDINFNY